MKTPSKPSRSRKKPTPSVQEEKVAPTRGATFPIVGIGASAGGFEALEQFLGSTPVDSGMAFVVVQHLDPTRKGLMAELLQRYTRMKVEQVTDRTKVRPNHVYVIPPNKDMSVLHGVLHLFEPSAKRGLRLPIDFFFSSLALDMRQMAIGVILSGMGSDGTQGLRAIKEHGGLALAQEPASAKFDSMPLSVINAGLADIVAPVEELTGKIVGCLAHMPDISKCAEDAGPEMRSALEKILILLRTRTTHDFSFYKKSTLYRRIERRMGIHQIDKIASYMRFLRENPEEVDLLFRELLIGVTAFFRDPAVWKHLQEKTLPDLLAGHPPGLLRAWVAGCSTGEEAYTLAIVFKEAMAKLKPKKDFKLQIFATDLDRNAIQKARVGVYPDGIVANVTQEYLRNYFIKEDNGYRVRPEIREMVIFSPHSLIMDPPFTKLDFLSCRNLLIYLAPEMQKKLFPLFHYSLNAKGILLLGNAETIGSFTGLFATVNGKLRIYRSIEPAMRGEPIEFPSSFTPAISTDSPSQMTVKPYLNLQAQAEQLVLRRFSPPTVLVNEQGNILHISGRTGKYLEPAIGKANLNIFAMARDGLRYELTAAFQKALRHPGPVVSRNLKIEASKDPQYVDITIEKLEDPEPLAGLLIIIFHDIHAPVEEKKAPGRAKKGQSQHPQLAELERELQQARTELRDTRQDMQTSKEELRSANEELQSTNEEMQSTNEELTTSKEEMQSLNEELQTVNSELQEKVDELSLANTDMKNLLNSTNIATLFLDNDLKIRRFTTQATKLIQLIPGDVGRPVTDLASSLLYPGLPDDAREVLRVLGSVEKSIRADDGSWYTVRTMPYRTLDDRIHGLVITFLDISVAKSLEEKLQEMQVTLQTRLAGQTVELDQARTDLKTERSQARKSGRKPPGPAKS